MKKTKKTKPDLAGHTDWTVPNYCTFLSHNELMNAQKAFEKFRKDIRDILGNNVNKM